MYIAVLQCGLLADGRLPHRDSRIRRSWVVESLHSKSVREGGKRAGDGRSTGRHSFGAARETKTAVSFLLVPASAIPASKTGVQSWVGSCGWSRGCGVSDLSDSMRTAYSSSCRLQIDDVYVQVHVLTQPNATWLRPVGCMRVPPLDVVHARENDRTITALEQPFEVGREVLNPRSPVD